MTLLDRYIYRMSADRAGYARAYHDWRVSGLPVDAMPYVPASMTHIGALYMQQSIDRIMQRVRSALAHDSETSFDTDLPDYDALADDDTMVL